MTQSKWHFTRLTHTLGFGSLLISAAAHAGPASHFEEAPRLAGQQASDAALHQQVADADYDITADFLVYDDALFVNASGQADGERLSSVDPCVRYSLAADISFTMSEQVASFIPVDNYSCLNIGSGINAQNSDFLPVSRAQIVPEPCAMALLGLGRLAITRRRPRKEEDD